MQEEQASRLDPIPPQRRQQSLQPCRRPADIVRFVISDEGYFHHGLLEKIRDRA